MVASQARPGYIFDTDLDDWVPIAGVVDTSQPYNFNINSTIGGNTIINNSMPISGFRNLIINGDMQISQRSTSVSNITTTGYYTADRWQLANNGQGTWTMSVEDDAPTGSGFKKSTKLICTTADSSPASSDNLLLRQLIEGQNLQNIAKGTTSAKELSLSFWVKSNITGTYIIEIFDIDNSRQVSKSYTISSAATWEKKTISVPSDIIGMLDNDNDSSLTLSFYLGAGSTFTSGTLNTSWQSNTNANRAVGQTNLASAINNYWQITGVQLEPGSVFTPFEQVPVGIELSLCQRYYYKHETARYLSSFLDGGSSQYPGIFIYHPVPMRVKPTSTFISIGVFYYNSGSATASFTPSGGATGLDGGVHSGFLFQGNITNGPGAAHSQKAGQWLVQAAFSAEL